MRLTLAIFLFISLGLKAQKPELLVQLGHSDRVKCSEFSSDGQHVLTAGNDQMLKLWEAKTGLLIRTFYGHHGMIYDATMSHDSKFIYSCSADDKLLLKWNVADGKILKTYKNPSISMTHLAASADGNFLAVCTSTGIVLFETKTFTPLNKISLKETSIATFSQDGHYLLTATSEYQNEKINIYRLPDLALIQSIEAMAFIHSLSEAKQRIMIANTNEFAIYEFASGRKLFAEKMDALKLTASQLSKDGTTIALAFENGDILAKNMESGVERNFEKLHDALISEIAYDPSGDYLVTACNDWTSAIYSTETNKPVRHLKSHSEFIKGISLNSKGDLLAFASGNLETGNHIGIWNLARGKLLPFYKSEDKASFFSSVAVNQRNTAICASNTNGSTYWYGYPNTGYSASLSVESSAVTCVAFTPNGKNSISGTKSGLLIFWRPDRNKNETLSLDKAGISSLCMSADGSLIFAGTFDGKVYSVDYATKTILKSINSHTAQNNYYDTSWVMSYGAVMGVTLSGQFAMSSTSIMGVACSTDNESFATCGGNWIKIFDARSGELKRHIVQYGAGFTAISYSNDGRMICAGGADFKVRVFDVESGTLKNVFSGHQNEVNSVLFNKSGKFIVSGSYDTQIKIWDLENGTELLSYILLKGGEDYIITNPLGYYFATKGAGSILSFRVKNEVFPFRQFDLKYNRPDLILENISRFAYGDTKENPNNALIKSYYAAYQKRLFKMGYKESDLGTEFHVPSVYIHAKKIPLSTSSRSLSFEINAEDNLFNLSRIQVRVNDVPIYGYKGKLVSGNKISLQCDLQLCYEKNHITVSCFNAKGAESYYESFNITYKGGTQNYNTYFIGIGVSNYSDTSYNLKFSTKDVNDLAVALKKKYPNLRTILLTEEEVNKENIFKLKQKLLQTDVNDKVILSLSGHGLLGKEFDFYYATHDMDFDEPEKNGLLYEDLENLMADIPARHKLLLMDACHSGELDKSEGYETTEKNDSNAETGELTKGAKLIKQKTTVGLDNSFELMQDLFTDVSYGTGATVISAAGGKEFALEGSKWNNGVFTFCVLSALNEGKSDKNQDGMTTVGELKNYVISEVLNLTGGRQKPTVRKENIENDWTLW